MCSSVHSPVKSCSRSRCSVSFRALKNTKCQLTCTAVGRCDSARRRHLQMRLIGVYASLRENAACTCVVMSVHVSLFVDIWVCEVIRVQVQVFRERERERERESHTRVLLLVTCTLDLYNRDSYSKTHAHAFIPHSPMQKRAFPYLTHTSNRTGMQVFSRYFLAPILT